MGDRPPSWLRRQGYLPLVASIRSSSTPQPGDGAFQPNTEHNKRSRRLRDPVTITLLSLTLGGIIFLAISFPFPTTIHVFLPSAAAFSLWVGISWVKFARRRSTHLSFIWLFLSSALVGYWAYLGVIPPEEQIPPLPDGDKYFIAANLYNNEPIMKGWSDEMVKLVKHLGVENTFVSIYESNSNDATPDILIHLGERLTSIGVGHRIISDMTERWWPYITSPERIAFLAHARNRALEPLQSESESERLPDYESFTKVLFLNDVVWTWRAALELLATEGGEYDLACGMDFGMTGMYDVWVGRDVCGVPMRIMWPHVEDPVSVALLRRDEVFPVSVCWNGMVAFPTGPVLYRPPVSPVPSGGMPAAPDRSNHSKRGWKMVDNANDSHSIQSPPLTLPLKFRTSGIDACDHSECFLFSYDLHRLYTDPARPPRIFMNPNVRLAYWPRWWVWNNVVLQIPVVKWWRYYWSHGVPQHTVEWLINYLSWRRDFCTWAALAPHLPERCAALPGAISRSYEVAG